MNILNSKIRQESFWSLVIKVIYTGLGFITSVLLARFLGTSGFGVYSYVYSIIIFLSAIPQFGLPPLVLRETARGMAQENAHLVKGIWVWAGRIAILLAFVLMVIGGLAGWVLGPHYDEIYISTFWIALILLPLITINDLRGSALRGLQRVLEGQIPEYLIRPSFLVLFLSIFFFVGIKLTVTLAMLLQVFASLISFGFGLWFLTKHTPTEVKLAVPQFKHRTWRRSVLPFAMGSGLYFVDKSVSTLLLGFFLSPDQIGIFRVAIQISVLATFGIQAMSMVVTPQFAKMHAENNKAGLENLVVKSARVTFAFNFLVFLVGIILGRNFLELFYGAEFIPAYEPALILLAGQLFSSSAGLVGALLNMTGFERDSAKAGVVSTILNILFGLAFIALLGIIGAAIAAALVQIIWIIILLWTARKRLNITASVFNFHRHKNLGGP